MTHEHDLQALQKSRGDSDNEFGYSCQVVRVREQMAGVVRQDLPA